MLRVIYLNAFGNHEIGVRVFSDRKYFDDRHLGLLGAFLLIVWLGDESVSQAEV